MSKIYSGGIVSPKGFDLSASEPVDQRTIVATKNDLYSLLKTYPGIEVKVQDETFKAYKLIAQPSADSINWIEVGEVGPVGPAGPDGPIGPEGPQGVAGTAVEIQGTDTVVNILLKVATTAGLMWIASDTGTDDNSNPVAAGDGMVSDGAGWGTVGPIRGPIGLTGDQGIQGIDGPTGPTGVDGPTGPAGTDGTDGSIGATGPQGPQGDQGLPGVTDPYALIKLVNADYTTLDADSNYILNVKDPTAEITLDSTLLTAGFRQQAINDTSSNLTVTIAAGDSSTGNGATSFSVPIGHFAFYVLSSTNTWSVAIGVSDSNEYLLKTEYEGSTTGVVKDSDKLGGYNASAYPRYEETVILGETVFNELCLQHLDGKWYKASADDIEITTRLIYVGVGGDLDDSVTAWNNASIGWSAGSSFPIGTIIYLSNTAGQWTDVIPPTGIAKMVGTVVPDSNSWFPEDRYLHFSPDHTTISVDGSSVNGVPIPLVNTDYLTKELVFEAAATSHTTTKADSGKVLYAGSGDDIILDVDNDALPTGFSFSIVVDQQDDWLPTLAAGNNFYQQPDSGDEGDIFDVFLGSSFIKSWVITKRSPTTASTSRVQRQVLAATSLTIDSSHFGKVIYLSDPSPITVTIEDSLVYRDGDTFSIVQSHLGQITIVVTGTATLNSTSTIVKTNSQYSTIQVIAQGVGQKSWHAIGDLENN